MLATALLRSLEINPAATFTDSYLGAVGSPEEVKLLATEGVLREQGLPRSSFIVQWRGAVYFVSRTDHGYVGVEDDESEPEIVKLDERDLRRFRIDMSALAALIRKTNRLSGEAEVVNERLWLLGEDPFGLICLALFNDDERFEAEALALVEKLPQPAGQIGLLSPSRPLRQLCIRRLLEKGFHILRFSRVLPFVIEQSQYSLEPKAESAFVHSSDYRSVNLRGNPFTLSEKQAAVVATLHRAHRTGLEGLPWTAIKDSLKLLEYYPERMQDVFKGVRNWRELVRLVKRGFYALNL